MRRLLLPCLMLSACATTGVSPTPLLPEFPVPQPIHARSVPARTGTDAFRLLIGGHLYGGAGKATTPAATFLAARNDLAATGADMLLLCGDTFRFSSESCFADVTSSLAPLPFPVYNAVGNHDVTVRAAYEARFGATYGAFVHAGCAFLLLDTERDPWEISGEQLAFLRRALQVADDREDVRAVFCLCHKLVHCHRKRYFEVLGGSNAFDGLARPSRFAVDVLPMLADVARSKPVYWCAGDIGLPHTRHVMFDSDPTSGVNFLAIGLGDLERDSLLQVDVERDEVTVRVRSLADGTLSSVDRHGVEAWRARLTPEGLSPQLRALRALLPE